MSTPFHAKYWAESLRIARPGLARSIANARVDLNPHQVDAALFALRSPFSKGVLLADEVGLGKTIEAGLVISQRWAERQRRILLVVPATLRRQWATELETKFSLQSTILEAATFNELKRNGGNPFESWGKIIIASYQFVYAKRVEVAAVAWNLVVADEAHRLRNVHKEPKTIVGIVEAIRPARKLLLTATPFQNDLFELYSLVSILDPELFGGGLISFRHQFVTSNDPDDRRVALRARIKHVYKRTLRKQVLEYVNFTDRKALTFDFVPSPNEQRLYDEVSTYLQREKLVALPNAQRKLITLILRKLLASSSQAIGATIGKFAKRLEDLIRAKSAASNLAPKGAAPSYILGELADEFESASEIGEEWKEEPAITDSVDLIAAAAELADLQSFVAMAKSIARDAKADALLKGIKQAIDLATEKGAAEKAVVFTESRQTQRALFELLTANGYAGQIVLMNGTNADEASRRAYVAWRKRNAANWDVVSSGTRTADMKAAIIEEFRDRGTILLATESAAEGVNLQFCSIVVNYDLPWNPQRIEQRIGRCHRYGQKCDVVVVNFLNRSNAADARVFDLLSQKFRLFEGVFGASDEVLGAVESGVDFERAIADIYQTCRTPEQVQTGFDAIQKRLEVQIRARLVDTRLSLLENLDEEVIAKLRVQADDSRGVLNEQQRTLSELARYELDCRATFSSDEPSFEVTTGAETGSYHLDWKRAEELGRTFFRPDGILAKALIDAAQHRLTAPALVEFAYEAKASALDPWRGRSGWLAVERLRVTLAEQVEEHLVVAAVTLDGERLPSDVAPRFFALRGEVHGSAVAPPANLSVLCDGSVDDRLGLMEERRTQLLAEEEEKLEHWAEDVTVGVEHRIKELDEEIAAREKALKRLATSRARVAAAKAIAALETERTNCRRSDFERESELERRREALETQVYERKIGRTLVLALQWKLSGCPTSFGSPPSATDCIPAAHVAGRQAPASPGSTLVSRTTANTMLDSRPGPEARTVAISRGGPSSGTTPSALPGKPTREVPDDAAGQTITERVALTREVKIPQDEPPVPVSASANTFVNEPRPRPGVACTCPGKPGSHGGATTWREFARRQAECPEHRRR